MSKLKTFVIVMLTAGMLLFGAFSAGAQPFGFDAAEKAPAASGASLGGSVSFTLLAFPRQLLDGEFTDSTVLPKVKLEFKAAGEKAEGYVSLDIDKNILIVEVLDEAWLRIFEGRSTIQAGLMRVSWGRADSMSVLDVLNPRDLRDLTVRDEKEIKIPMPMIRFSESLGEVFNADLVYIPWFEGDRIADSGLWASYQILALKQLPGAFPFGAPTTTTLEYGQAGLRVTAALKGIDLGAQYFYGYMTTPSINMIPYALSLGAKPVTIGYNRYHHLGLDTAFVLAGLNIRLETAANITEDIEGDDPVVYNNNIAWTAGFDRELFAGIDLNFQAMGMFRLSHDKITNALDIEKDTDMATVRLAVLLSRSFWNERLKLELLGMTSSDKWDYMVEPGAVVAFGDAEIALRGRYFDGDAKGQFGQFNSKSYLTLSTKYKF